MLIHTCHQPHDSWSGMHSLCVVLRSLGIVDPLEAIECAVNVPTLEFATSYEGQAPEDTEWGPAYRCIGMTRNPVDPNNRHSMAFCFTDGLGAYGDGAQWERFLDFNSWSIYGQLDPRLKAHIQDVELFKLADGTGFVAKRFNSFVKAQYVVPAILPFMAEPTSGTEDFLKVGSEIDSGYGTAYNQRLVVNFGANLGTGVPSQWLLDQCVRDYRLDRNYFIISPDTPVIRQ